MSRIPKIMNIRTQDLLVPTVTVLTLHLICISILTVCMVTTSMQPVNTVYSPPVTTPMSLATLVPQKLTTLAKDVLNVNNNKDAVGNRTNVIDVDTPKKNDLDTSPITTTITTPTTVPTTITTATTAQPLPTAHPLDGCYRLAKYFLISYIFAWIIFILIETLIIGFAISGTQMNTALAILLKIKIGLFLLELILLITNISLIADYVGFSIDLNNKEKSCLVLPTMKAVIDLTIFNWIIICTIIVALISYLLKNLLDRQTDDFRVNGQNFRDITTL